MFSKLSQAQQQIEEIKNRLDAIQVTGEACGGMIKVTATANKDFKDLSIHPDFLANAGKEELEEVLIVAINKTLEQAGKVSQAEMEAVTKGMFGGLGGMFGN
jgi:DNA-binding YbaB/EbfC family protein